jgi:hypothetical protein
MKKKIDNQLPSSWVENLLLEWNDNRVSAVKPASGDTCN